MAVSTSAQRAVIKRLMDDMGLPLDVVSTDHVWAFQGAGVPCRVGEVLDHRLAQLSRNQAYLLITELEDD